MHFQVPRGPMVVFSLLHFQAVRVCVPGFLVVNSAELIDDNNLLSSQLNGNRLYVILHFDASLDNAIRCLEELELCVHVLPLEVKYGDNFTDVDLLGLDTLVLLRVVMGIKDIGSEDVGTRNLSVDLRWDIVIEVQLEILGFAAGSLR